MAMIVDYVIPFVDCSDRNWIVEYRKNVHNKCDWSNNARRFRDWGILRYQLRSVSKYLPWINNIYILLSISETQIPTWLNTANSKIHIIYDWEFIPLEHLPVFNSNAIDLFIPNIKGLSEHYLYACDDYIITRSLKISDFFYDNGIFLKLENHTFNPSVYSETIINSNNLINGNAQIIHTKHGYIMPYCDHAIIPHIKSKNVEILHRYNKEINYSVSTFRESKNLTWLIYPLSLRKDGFLKKGNIKTRYCELRSEEDIQNLSFKDCDMIVLNDEYHDNYYYGRSLLGIKLEEVFPYNCEYEYF